jgi:hypothetical protein
MDKLIETIAKYLCRHRSVGLLRLTLDLTRRRLDIFAEIDAAEVAKGVVSPPTPGIDAWRRAVAAVREAVVAREGACPVRMGGGGGQLDGPDLLTNQTPNRQLRRMAYFSRLAPFLRFCEAPKNGASSLPNAV